MTARPERRPERDDDRAPIDVDDADRDNVSGERVLQRRLRRCFPAVADPAYVLCEHGYLRRGWCDQCEP
jgi:hypothetical protein